MKTLSWMLTPLLAGLLIYAAAQVPPPAGPGSSLSTHLARRYQQRSAPETGIQSPAGAVLADHRSFDLLAAAILFFTAALAVLLFFQHPPGFLSLLPSFVWLVLGTGLSLGLGFLCLRGGSNFLDYEALAAWAEPARARLDGALILLAGTFFCLAGLLTLWVRWVRTPEGSSGR